MHLRLRSALFAAVALWAVLPPAPASSAPTDLVASPSPGGLAVERPGHYDLQPTTMFDPEDPARPHKMWWLGQYREGDRDLAPSRRDQPAVPSDPAGFTVGDRIYFSDSPDGVRWSAPEVVLKGRAGSSGGDAADDHLLGSPSVVKHRGRYYMFYEAYGTWATAIQRMFAPARGDTWTTNGLAAQISSPGFDGRTPAGDWDPAYQFEKNQGFAPLYPKAGTRPIYAGEVRYGNGKYNRFLSKSPVTARIDAQGAVWRPLNAGVPVFHLYTTPGSDRQPLVSAWDWLHSNTFVTANLGAEGPAATSALVEHLGYAATRLDGPSLLGCNQNRVMLATSTDGKTWERVTGGARGGAVVSPWGEAATARRTSSTWPQRYGAPGERWDVVRDYGAGYPCAVIRDGSLELFWTEDYTAASTPGNVRTTQQRLRIPLASVGDPSAYAAALAAHRALGETAPDANVAYGHDAKWSRADRRYVALSIRPMTPTLGATDPAFDQRPLLVWSAPRPMLGGAATRAPFAAELAPGLVYGGAGLGTEHWARWGAIVGDPLGNLLPTVDGAGHQIDVVYEAIGKGLGNDNFATDLRRAGGRMGAARATDARHAVSRWVDAGGNDRWVTGEDAFTATSVIGRSMAYDWVVGYGSDRILGFGYALEASGRAPLYAGERVGRQGARDRYLSKEPVLPATNAKGETLRPLHGGAPAFWVATAPGAGRIALRSVYDAARDDVYETTSADLEARPGARLTDLAILGYLDAE